MIRPAEPWDAPRLAEVFAAVLADGRGMVLPAGAAEGVETLVARIRGPGVFLVAEVDGVVVGEGTLRAYGPAWLAHGALLAMHVHPDAQGRGVGRALLDGLLAAARREGFVRVELFVRADNPRALALYRSAGFVREGVRRAFVRPAEGPAVDDWVMARFLHAPAAEKAVALVVREGVEGPEVLVFTHPLAGVQLPRGTIEVGEAPEAAARRELAEESGLTDVEVVAALPTWDQPTADDGEDGWPILHRYHALVLRPTGEVADAWTWAATGSEEEEGLVFAFSWQPMAHVSLHPCFDEAVGRLAGWMERGAAGGVGVGRR